jgi:hypothetical protein
MGLSPRLERPVSIRVAAGTPFVEIIRRAREEAANLILVGAHGAQFIKDLLFGTTAEKVVRKGDRPVLVVKRPTRGPYRRVLAATDFSDHLDKRLSSACGSRRAQDFISFMPIRELRDSSGGRKSRSLRSCVIAINWPATAENK